MLIEWISAETGLSRARLMSFAATASKRYFVFPLEKRDGTFRQIAHPAKPLKGIQRWLNSRVIKRWDVHGAATAYQRGSSIRSNAFRHASTNFTLRMDFENFFPSFKSAGISKFLLEKNSYGLDLNEEDVKFISNIVTRNGELTIGAPSSPFLTNAMMYSFDQDVSIFCEKNGLIYTRYADDLFISSIQAGKLQDAYKFVCMAAAQYPYARLVINEKKTKFLSRKYKRQVTGLVITPDRKISVGRGRKREIKSLVNSFSYGDLDFKSEQYLKGMVAFVFDCDHDFFLSLKRKYGERVIGKLIG